MSHTTRSSALRPLSVAGFLAAAALAAPTAHAQSSSEVALMNHLAPTIFVPNALALGSAAAFPVPNDAVSGEVALLARTPIIHTQNPQAGPAETVPSVSGADALLGTWSPLDPRRGRSRRITVSRSSMNRRPLQVVAAGLGLIPVVTGAAAMLGVDDPLYISIGMPRSALLARRSNADRGQGPTRSSATSGGME